MNETVVEGIVLAEAPKVDPLRSFARKNLAYAAVALAAVATASVIYARKHQESDSETSEDAATETVTD